MKLLLKQVIIADGSSSFNGQQKDILIASGLIVSIADNINDTDAVKIEQQGLYASAGWVDTFSHFCDPGFEHRETIESGAAAAAAGGFTTVFIVPNTSPVVSTKSNIQYITQRAQQLPVTVLPLGAITKNAEGKELAEMYDMLQSGSVAFSDGLQPVQSAGLLLKALQYTKAFNGVIIQMPVDKSISNTGLVNEGIVSTQLGLPGIPAIAEELMINRDIELARYTGSRLHISGISTARGIEMVGAAKAEGLQVTCSVTPYHLWFCDEDLAGYDTNLKVHTPLRTRDNMMALRQAVTNGLVDCIASHHIPQDWDGKVCEFEYAKMGMAGLESCFAAVNSLFSDMPVDKLMDLLCVNACKIFNLQQHTIAEGNPANITLFTRQGEHTFTREMIKGLCTNNAFVGKQLTGTVAGVIHKDQLYLN